MPTHYVDANGKLQPLPTGDNALTREQYNAAVVAGSHAAHPGTPAQHQLTQTLVEAAARRAEKSEGETFRKLAKQLQGVKVIEDRPLTHAEYLAAVERLIALVASTYDQHHVTYTSQQAGPNQSAVCVWNGSYPVYSGPVAVVLQRVEIDASEKAAYDRYLADDAAYRQQQRTEFEQARIEQANRVAGPALQALDFDLRSQFAMREQAMQQQIDQLNETIRGLLAGQVAPQQPEAPRDEPPANDSTPEDADQVSEIKRGLAAWAEKLRRS